MILKVFLRLLFWGKTEAVETVLDSRGKGSAWRFNPGSEMAKGICGAGGKASVAGLGPPMADVMCIKPAGMGWVFRITVELTLVSLTRGGMRVVL